MHPFRFTSGCMRPALFAGAVAALLALVPAASADCTDPSPTGFNGSVRAISAPDSHGIRYVGGDFTAYGNKPRNHLAAIDSQGVLQPWNPNVSGGSKPTVKSVVLSGSTVFVGGSFTKVGTMARSNAAAISTTGAIQPWNPNVAGSGVYSIALARPNVYLGGSFTKVAGTARSNAAAVSTAGQLMPWNPAPNGAVNALLVGGSNVYIGGSFSKLGRTVRNNAAAVATNGTLQAWNPNIGTKSGFPPGYGEVRALAISGTTIYIGGGFESVSGTRRGNLAAVGTNGSLLPWGPDASSGDSMDSFTIYALSVVGSTIYVGGSFYRLGGFGPDGADRRGAGAFSSSGALLPWHPVTNLVTFFALSATSSRIYVGAMWSTEDRASCLAVLDTSGNVVS